VRPGALCLHINHFVTLNPNKPMPPFT
jgi:hypothetical protein